MKKSKIIVPALGLLLLSTAASVSGTVAWFTANRTFNTSAGNFAVVKTSTDLVCVMDGGVGTRVNNNGSALIYSDDTIELANTAATASVDGVAVELTDASFDHDTKNVILPDADGVKVKATDGIVSITDGSFAAKTTRATYTTSAADVHDTTHTVYSALTWTMDFQVSYTAAGSNSGLFFNLTNTKFTLPNGDAFGATDAGHGFRLAFIPTGDPENNTVTDNYIAGNTRVLARAQSAAETWDHDDDGETAAVSKVRYIDNAVAGSSLNSLANTYTSPILIDSTATYDIPSDNTVAASSLSSQPAYLGKFTAAASKTVHMPFTVVAWFEGTDPTVVNTANLAALVKASMTFELRTVTD